MTPQDHLRIEREKTEIGQALSAFSTILKARKLRCVIIVVDCKHPDFPNGRVLWQKTVNNVGGHLFGGVPLSRLFLRLFLDLFAKELPAKTEYHLVTNDPPPPEVMNN